MSEVEKIFRNHSFRIDGVMYCSYDSVYDDMRDLYPQKSHDEICDMMREFDNE